MEDLPTSIKTQQLSRVFGNSVTKNIKRSGVDLTLGCKYQPQNYILQGLLYNFTSFKRLSLNFAKFLKDFFNNWFSMDIFKAVISTLIFSVHIHYSTGYNAIVLNYVLLWYKAQCRIQCFRRNGAYTGWCCPLPSKL